MIFVLRLIRIRHKRKAGMSAVTMSIIHASTIGSQSVSIGSRLLEIIALVKHTAIKLLRND